MHTLNLQQKLFLLMMYESLHVFEDFVPDKCSRITHQILWKLHIVLTFEQILD